MQVTTTTERVREVVAQSIRRYGESLIDIDSDELDESVISDIVGEVCYLLVNDASHEARPKSKSRSDFTFAQLKVDDVVSFAGQPEVVVTTVPILVGGTNPKELHIGTSIGDVFSRHPYDDARKKGTTVERGGVQIWPEVTR